MNVTANSFEASNREAVMNMRRQLIEYVSNLHEALSGGTAASNVGNVRIQYDDAGWPRLVGFDEQNKLGKDELEVIIRAYLSKHYGTVPTHCLAQSDVLRVLELATQGMTAHVPYSDIFRRQSSYIAAEYLPKTKIAIRDPRNMSRDDVKAFLCHIAARQLTMPLNQVFRFKKIAPGRKGNGKLESAVYPGDMDAAAAEALREEKLKEKRRRASRKKGKRVPQPPPVVTAEEIAGLIPMPVPIYVLSTPKTF